MDLGERRARYAKVSTALAHLDDAALRRLLPSRSARQGWGTTHRIEVDGEPVFVKIVPLTDLERERPYSTRNHYGLPTYYQYGVGSAGFGAWREIVTHVTTTNWVLAGEIETFPLMYHFRVVPRPNLADPFGSLSLDKYVRGWNGSKNIARYIDERLSGSHAALIFLELLPHSIWDWLTAHPADLDRMVRQLCDTLSFLRERGIAHLDGHFDNVMTDGERAYLGDFGLALDARFDLSARERAFLERHQIDDYGKIVHSVGALLLWWYGSLSTSRQAAVERRLGDVSLIGLVRGVEKLDGEVPPELLDAVLRYREVIAFMDDFFTTLRANPRKNTPFDDAELGRLLRAAGVV